MYKNNPYSSIIITCRPNCPITCLGKRFSLCAGDVDIRVCQSESYGQFALIVLSSEQRDCEKFTF